MDESSHWKLMNIMARLLGLMALVVGLAFLVSAALYWHDPQQAASVPSASGSSFGDSIGVSIFCLVVGTLFVLVDPCRPDLKARTSASPRQRRSWWTGTGAEGHAADDDQSGRGTFASETPIIDSRVTRAASCASENSSVPAGRAGKTI